MDVILYQVSTAYGAGSGPAGRGGSMPSYSEDEEQRRHFLVPNSGERSLWRPSEALFPAAA